MVTRRGRSLTTASVTNLTAPRATSPLQALHRALPVGATEMLYRFGCAFIPAPTTYGSTATPRAPLWQDERIRLEVGHGEVGSDRIGQLERVRAAGLRLDVLHDDPREKLAELDHLGLSKRVAGWVPRE